MTGKSGDCTLWMGNIESYMDENFLMQAFTASGFHIKQIKMAKNKFNPAIPADYCFVEFYDEAAAANAIKVLVGQHIPNTNPRKFYVLNFAGPNRPKDTFQGFSVWVGDLDTSVDDGVLLKHFKTKYSSAVSAKVVYDMSGVSREFGFVRFDSENDQLKAMVEMNNTTFAGRNIRVKSALPKKTTTTTGTTNTITPQQQQQQQQYNQQWAQQQQQQQQQYYAQQQAWYASYEQSYYNAGPVEDTDALEEPVLIDEPTQINRDFVATSGEVYKAMQDSRWFGSSNPHAASTQINS